MKSSSVESSPHASVFRRQVAGSIQQVAEELITTLRELGFAILSRIEFRSKLISDSSLGKQHMVVRLSYPYNEGSKSIENRLSMIRCSAVLSEKDHGKISVELSKPVRLLTLEDPTLTHLCAEVDRRLCEALKLDNQV